MKLACVSLTMMMWSNMGVALATSHKRKLVMVGPSVTVMPNAYTVVFDDTVHHAATKVAQLSPLLHASSAKVSRVYNTILKGMALTNVTVDLLDQLLQDPEVKRVQPNVAGTLSAVQTNVDWGLDRIDQVGMPLDGNYNYVSTGKNVRVFVVDSGLRWTHTEFEGRATCGYDVMDETDIPCEDVKNHGTSVAAIVGGKTVGVAKQVSLVGVKVGTSTTLWSDDGLAGMEYVLKQKKKHPNAPMIVMMAMVYPENIVDEGTAALINANVTVVISAGNSERDACVESPATVPGVIVVGSSGPSDDFSSFSNFGDCVDIYAPGERVRTAKAKNDTHLSFVYGTSFAAPFVAGVAARMLSQNPNLTPFEIEDILRRNATDGWLLHFSETPPSPPCRFKGWWAKTMCKK